MNAAALILAAMGLLLALAGMRVAATADPGTRTVEVGAIVTLCGLAMLSWAFVWGSA